MCENSLKSMFESYEVYLLWSYYEYIIQLLNLISMKNNLNIKKNILVYDYQNLRKNIEVWLSLKSNFKENVGVHELPEKKFVREKPHLGKNLKKLKFNFDLFLPVFTSQ